MKLKTARRWLDRNQWKIALHKTHTIIQSPAFVRRWQKCARRLYQELH